MPSRKSLRFQISLAVAALAFGCSSPSDPAAFEQKAAWAANAFPAPVITQEQLHAEGASNFLVVDTRAEEEFAVSHLPGAINWPDYKCGDLPKAVRRHAAEGKTVVFYCSIGYRSGDATVRAAKMLGPEAKAFNLRGGTFQWGNEGGALEGSDRVHGYDEEWGKLLKPERRADAGIGK